MRQLINFRGQVGQIRTATFKGKDHVVIPVTALVEGVMQAENAPGPELVEKDVFARTAGSWNGRPVLVNHPRRDGELVSANAPDILEKGQLGHIFEASVKDDKLVLEAWIDRELVDEKGGVEKETIDRAAEGGVVEVSIGAFVDVEKREGEHNGRAFEGRWINVVPDHLAILEEGKTGACSVEDGCGTNRAAEACGCGPGCKCKREAEEPKKLLEKAVVAMRAVPGEIAKVVFAALAARLRGQELSDVDRRSLLENRLADEFPNDFIFIISVFDDTLVYAQSGKLWQRNYSIENDQLVTFGEETTEVTPRTDFIAVKKHGDEEEDKDRKMTKAERVKALIASDKTRFEATDEKWLLSLEDGQLDKMEPETVSEDGVEEGTGEDTAAAAIKEPTEYEPVTAEAFLAAAPPDVRSLLSEGLRLQKAKKAHFVKVLAENPRNGFERAALDKMDTETLERMARLADLPDYSARGAASDPTPKAEDDPWMPPTMPQVFDLSKPRSVRDLMAAKN